jgi:asparagine synthase (glutamine-hydrolysing)
MCGITGYFQREPLETDLSILVRMTRNLRHRGPDDEGFALINTRANLELDCSGAESDRAIRDSLPAIERLEKSFTHDLAFSHRRYSIVDVSSRGHQPMWDTTEQVCVSFNGEIYNYIELREELEKRGYPFRTRSDTEVLATAYLEWDTALFSRLNGFWAMALYDRRKKTLLLARDRMGKAPLYYARATNRLYWASEIKSILDADGENHWPVRDQAVDDYILYGSRDVDGTFWQGIDDFPAASFAWVQSDLSLNIQRYWQLPQQRLSTSQLSVHEATAGLRGLLSDAIKLRIRADVPVAFELSGGMDSSAIVALAASSLPNPVSAYTVEFAEEASNETRFARAVAQFYQKIVSHYVITPAKGDFWEEADSFVWFEEEPFHSPNLHSNQQLRRKIKENNIRVVITGSSGDEVLAGYASEYFAPFLRTLLAHGQLGQALREIHLNSEFPKTKSVLYLVRNLLTASCFAPLLHKLSRDYGQRSRHSLAGIYKSSPKVMLRDAKPASFNERMIANMGAGQMNYWLRSGNKSNYAIPIEARVPFLDYRVVEYAFTLPPQYLIHGGWHKWILRMVAKDILPDEVVWRREKMGFPFPYREWLAYSKRVVKTKVEGVECPYLNPRPLMKEYDRVLAQDPLLLWRTICLALWWKKMIQKRPLSA